MKKAVKRIWIAIGSILILLFVFLGINIYQLKTEVNRMTPVETKEIIPGIFSVRDAYVNLYLMKGKSRYIAFDSGNDPDRVRKEILKLNIDPAEVTAVFLTHGDSDHAGGLPLFQNAAVYLPGVEEQMVDGRTARVFIFKNKHIREHKMVNDNQTMVVDGLYVAAISTPGHTPGSACYFVDGQFLFTGDSMSLKTGKAELFSKKINMDSDTQRESLKKLSNLIGVRYVFTAHFGYSDSFEYAFENFRD